MKSTQEIQKFNVARVEEDRAFWYQILDEMDQDQRLGLPEYKKRAIAVLIQQRDRSTTDAFLNHIGWSNNVKLQDASTHISIELILDREEAKNED